MTETLFRDDAYLRHCQARVERVTADGIELDRTVFYPLGGGQPGDRGTLRLGNGREVEIVDTRHGANGSILHVPGESAALPEPGDMVEATLDWNQRYRHMRMHTCLHLLGAVLKFGVTGGSITASRSRLDFDMQDTVDKERTTRELNALIEANHAVNSRWISQSELQSQPELIRTLSVQPPKHAERIRLLDIPGVDLQPCGGTHVRQTAEIGPARVGKVEKKGRHNRRVHIVLDDD